jgi:hypothetical protein
VPIVPTECMAITTIARYGIGHRKNRANAMTMMMTRRVVVMRALQTERALAEAAIMMPSDQDQDRPTEWVAAVNVTLAFRPTTTEIASRYHKSALKLPMEDRVPRGPSSAT